MDLSNVGHFLHALFTAKPCAACQARDYTIAILKEEIHKLRNFYEAEVHQQHDDMQNIVKHITGMNRTANTPVTSGQLHSVPRQGGIQNRIARAEAADREKAGPIIEQRRKEFEARIAELEPKPETEVMGEKDASS